MQLGPTSRMPAARAVASIPRWTSRPPSSTSPKPDDRTPAAPTPRPASASMAAGTAGTRLAGDDTRDIVGPIADERQAFARERRHDQLTVLTIGLGLAAARVDDLRVVVILPDVDPGPRAAVDPQARAAGLGHPDDVERPDPELALDARAQLVRPHLRAQDPDPERQRAQIEALLACHLDEPEWIGRDRRQDGRAQVTHELELEQRAPGADGDDHRAQTLGAVVEAEAAAEQAEGRRDLDDAGGADARGHVAARHRLAPLLDVARRVRVEHRIAGRPAGHLDAPVPGAPRAGEPEGIGVAKVVLGEEGQAPPVVERLEVVGAHAPQPAVPCRVLADTRQRRAHALERQRRDPLARKRL